MSKNRLTRQELGWLLTQEAQGAAERLRVGVQVLRTNAPPPMITTTDGEPGAEVHVEKSLDALEDVMRMLSSLHSRPSSSGAPGMSAKGRRGRIDLASLLWEVAPEARVSIEPGSGTEVFGDESELRRMLHVLVGHGSGLGSQVTIRRDVDEVRVSVVLGPDSSATADTERAWLSRMATRYGGRHELEGGMEVLALPADGVSERKERDDLRKELDEARKQGEAYARELAAVFAHGEESNTPSSFPPMPLPRSTERFLSLSRIAGGVAGELRGMLSPVGRDLQALRAIAGKAESVDEKIEAIRKRLLHVQDFVAALASIGELDAGELFAEVDLIEASRTIVRALGPRAERNEVKLTLVTHPEAEGTRAFARLAPRATSVLLRELVSQAIEATSRGSEVVITVRAPDSDLGTRVTVDDQGASLPASARRAFMALELEPSTYGRPSSIPLYVAAEIASTQGALVELGDAPTGGLRVTLTFPR